MKSVAAITAALVLIFSLSGCARQRTNLDTIIVAKDPFEFALWQKENLPQLEAPWAAEFPQALDRLRVAEAYRNRVSKPEDVEKLLLKKIGHTTIRSVLLEANRTWLFQEVYGRKLVAALQAQRHIESSESSISQELKLQRVLELTRRLDPQFDYDKFCSGITVVVPPRSGEGNVTNPVENR